MEFIYNKIITIKKLNEDLCKNDPLNNYNTKLPNVIFDITLIIISLFLFLHRYKKIKSTKFFFSNSTNNNNNNNKLLYIRFFSAMLGCMILIRSYYIENVTFIRFIINQIRFLTQVFFIFMTLYYVSISIYYYIKKTNYSKVFNLLFGTVIFGSIFVSVGFWSIVILSKTIQSDYIWGEFSSYTFKFVDLNGHFLNLLIIMIESMFIPEIYIDICSIYLFIFLISCYTTCLFFLQMFQFICWIPYGPFLIYYKYKFIVFIYIIIIYICLKFMYFKQKLHKKNI